MKIVSIYFSSHHVESLLKINRKTLCYWRKVGIFSPTEKTKKGHFRYSFQDLVALKTIIKLRGEGITTYKVRKLAAELADMYPSINPFSKLSLYVIGKEVIVADDNAPFNPITKQGTFIRNTDIKKWIKKATLDSIGASNTLQAQVGVEGSR
ncbi:MAG: MerR family transcriptional regulator [bacterium]|jgi:DNA-binding transcriptional MerR regulator